MNNAKSQIYFRKSTRCLTIFEKKKKMLNDASIKILRNKYLKIITFAAPTNVSSLNDT